VRASKKGRGEEKEGGKEEIRSFSNINFSILDKKVGLLEMLTVPFMEYHRAAYADHLHVAV
jgi:hypothetical protein